MKTSFIKNISLVIVAVSLFACGGGSGSDTAFVPAPEVPAIQANTLSAMMDGIIAENVDHADHTTRNLDNYDVSDDIDGNANAEAAVNAMVDAMIAANNTQL